ncbi:MULTISPECIES: hypothetical protein [Rhizobium]|uniref:Uncharacterized protein n=1 Tax=Rhizobium tropici TaxID=398 RepID=A0ABR6QS47_RHITR|nr:MULTISPECIES: hypothetical protein [Rhizobium]MBB4239776.1 hypothetical protein [Rhizobium tropici]MBB5591046.1 hypothetical protein [Rhizobium tropici]MBB6489745.1 hypothetical protein [Rhizobium tropici]
MRMSAMGRPTVGALQYALTPWFAGVTTIDGKPGLEAVKAAIGL